MPTLEYIIIFVSVVDQWLSLWVLLFRRLGVQAPELPLFGPCKFIYSPTVIAGFGYYTHMDIILYDRKEMLCSNCLLTFLFLQHFPML